MRSLILFAICLAYISCSFQEYDLMHDAEDKHTGIIVTGNTKSALVYAIDADDPKDTVRARVNQYNRYYFDTIPFDTFHIVALENWDRGIDVYTKGYISHNRTNDIDSLPFMVLEEFQWREIYASINIREICFYGFSIPVVDGVANIPYSKKQRLEFYSVDVDSTMIQYTIDTSGTNLTKTIDTATGIIYEDIKTEPFAKVSGKVEPSDFNDINIFAVNTTVYNQIFQAQFESANTYHFDSIGFEEFHIIAHNKTDFGPSDWHQFSIFNYHSIHVDTLPTITLEDPAFIQLYSNSNVRYIYYFGIRIIPENGASTIPFIFDKDIRIAVEMLDGGISMYTVGSIDSSPAITRTNDLVNKVGFNPFEDTEAKCSDSEDNDLDGKTDCDDEECLEFCG